MRLVGDGSPRSDGPLIVLGRIEDGRRVEHVLAGWAEVCGQPSSLDWIRQRIQRSDG